MALIACNLEPIGWGLAALGVGIGVAGWRIGEGLSMFGNLTLIRRDEERDDG